LMLRQLPSSTPAPAVAVGEPADVGTAVA